MAVVARFTQDNQNPVGMIIPSMLTESQFQAINGANWVLAAGQSISGSKYATITGNTNAPDLRGRVLAGKDDMGGSAANRLTSGGSGVNGNTLGATGGAETHTLTQAQMPVHNHIEGYGDAGAPAGRYGRTNTGIVARTTGDAQGTDVAEGPFTSNSGSGASHNNTQPTLVVNYFIKIN